MPESGNSCSVNARTEAMDSTRKASSKTIQNSGESTRVRTSMVRDKVYSPKDPAKPAKENR
ncbi:hypothetical protein D3C75_1026090 [compost metagenome]